MVKQSKAESEHLTRNKTVCFLRKVFQPTSLRDDVKKILANQQEFSVQLKQQQLILNQLKELDMALKEDFDAFVVAVNDRTNEIGAALDEIATDIGGLLNPTTPPEMASAMTAIQDKLATLSASSKAIAALNNPVVPPDEPPL